MIDDVSNVGTSTPLEEMTPDEQSLLAGAVHESIRQQVDAMIERRGIVSSGATECPNCGQRVLYLDQPASYTFDRESQQHICSACGGERDFVQLFRPEADIGGEGG